MQSREACTKGDARIFAVRLRRLREKRRISMQVLADFCLVSRSTIQRYEAGKQDPTGPVLVRLADFLDCTTDYLLGIDKK